MGLMIVFLLVCLFMGMKNVGKQKGNTVLQALVGVRAVHGAFPFNYQRFCIVSLFHLNILKFSN